MPRFIVTACLQRALPQPKSGDITQNKPILGNKQIYIMSLSIDGSTLQIIGIVYSSIALALQVVNCFFFRVHSRALDYIQWAFILTEITTFSLPFSERLEVGSGVILVSEAASSGFFCPMGGFVCERPFALSFLVILAGFLIVMRLVTIPDKVTEKGITYNRIYRLFKGLVKWFYMPLLYLAIKYLMFSSVIADFPQKDLIASAVVLAVLVIYPFTQTLLYKFFAQPAEDPFIKWLELGNYAKAMLFSLLAVLVFRYESSVYYYYVALLIPLYAAIFALKYPFRYEVSGRVLYILGEVIFYFLLSLEVGQSDWIANYHLDLFLLGAVLLIDIVYTIMEGVVLGKEWKNSLAQVVPEDSRDKESPGKKKNAYDVDENIGGFNKVNSRDNLNDSGISSGILANEGDNTKKKGRARR